MRTPSGRPLPRAGFSLVEILIVIVLAGLMGALAMPKLRQGLVTRDVKSARAAIANMYARARVNALQTRKSNTVHFSGTQVWVTAPLGIAACVFVMLGLPHQAWERFGIWIVVGLLIYGSYGHRNSRLRTAGF